ncbi:MAG TPA: GNAT family N-acetyltransferase, partial [Candidatus Limnocylindrales bacterium]|nr:GNAT family N-acetyltransferase [Candidatus Limnocylindrales bacterium]
DWDAIADLVNAVHRADGIDEVRSGESLAIEYGDSESFTLAKDMLLAEIDGRLVGYSMGYRVVREGSLVAETGCVVHPDARRRRLGTALFGATYARLARECAEDPRPGPRELRTYVMEDEHTDRALLDAFGYVPVRYGFEMARPLTGSLPEHPLPEGLELRPVTEDQYRAIFDADNEAFEDHWGHRAPEEADFTARFHGPEQEPALWCVAWDGDQVAGVVMNAISADENEALGMRRGWLEHVSVRRPYRGKGVAKALCAASFRVLLERGMTEAWLGVDGSNPTGALQLYEGLGFAARRRWMALGRPLDRPAPAGWTAGGASEG